MSLALGEMAAHDGDVCGCQASLSLYLFCLQCPKSLFGHVVLVQLTLCTGLRPGKIIRDLPSD
jgi:hypothetical protein